ncbi:molybdopterin-dependent oxidoreductase [Kocuria sp. U4B]
MTSSPAGAPARIPARGRPPAGLGPWLLAGIAATALAVGLAELLAWVTGPVGAPLTAVGGVVVDAVPAPVKDAAIALFGTADKLVLVLVMAAGLIGLGAGIGAAQRANRPMGVVLLGVLGLLGLIAVLTRAGASVADLVPVVVGTGAGALLLAQLTRRAAVRDGGPGLDRRGFVRLAAAAAVLGTAAGVAGRWASTAAARVPAARELLRIPAPAVRERVPAGTDVGVDGVAPWLTPAEDFYRIDTALAVPRIDVADWRLRIHGLVDRELTLGFEDLTARPLLERAVTLACVSNPVGGDLVGNAVWSGVPLRELLAETGVQAGADMVLSTSQDGFTAGTPLEALTDPDRDSLLAVSMNGQPLPFEHGYPVRMVVPGLYGYVSATKWVVDLEVTRFDRAQAYWTTRGWSARGPVKLSSRIEVPRDRAGVDAGQVVLAGTAWAQHVGIAAVQVSVDGGDWQEARLGAATSDDTWRQWVLRRPDLPAGEHVVRVRAVDRDGTVQTAEQAPPAPDGASGLHERTFTVR